MASKLSREEVLRVAALARLELTESEIALFTRQIADILTHAEVAQRRGHGRHSADVASVRRRDRVARGRAGAVD